MTTQNYLNQPGDLMRVPAPLETPLQDAFEEWFCGGVGELKRAPDGYSLMSAQSAWIAWQAGSAWATLKERQRCSGLAQVMKEKIYKINGWELK